MSVGKPVADSAKAALSATIYPSECRERGITYKGKMTAKLCWRINDGPVQVESRPFGHLPIMVKSLRCHLDGKSPRELVKLKEDSDEFGGYFIINGIERLIRFLIVPKRNLPMALIRPSFQKRGPTYTNFGVQIRSVRSDQSSQTITLHYCTDGAVNLRFSYRKQEYMVPVLLVIKALQPVSDLDIFHQLASGAHAQNTFLTDRVELLLRSFRMFSLNSQDECLAFIGSKFHVMLDSAEDSTEKAAGIDFLRRIILVHLVSAKDKFSLLM